MTSKSHWEQVFSSRPTQELSWFQADAEPSLRCIENAGVALDAKIIDVGGGASTLVDGLLVRGYRNLTVFDISATALGLARRRIGEAADRVTWIEGDITGTDLPACTYDVWHDRAVFHFLVRRSDRRAYVDALLGSVRSNGHVIIAVFAEDGPGRCSGLPVARYSPSALLDELGPAFQLQEHFPIQHETPTGAVQSFVYCRFRRATQ